MKLYYSKGACSLGVRITLNELGVKFDAEAVNLKTKTTETGIDFLTINDKGYVPVLEIDNKKIITENCVIQQYLADTYPDSEILAKAPAFERYKTLEWLNYISTEIHKACGPLFNPSITSDEKETLFKPILLKKLHYANDYVSKQTFDKYSLTDGYLFVVLLWMKNFKIDLTDSFPALANFMKTMRERKAVKLSLEQEGIS